MIFFWEEVHFSIAEQVCNFDWLTEFKLFIKDPILISCNKLV